MKTLQEQFNLIQEGKGHKDMFLKSARRLFPEYVTNFATYGEATTILKQRGVLSEMIVGGGIVTQRTFDPFKVFNSYVSEASTQENPIKAPKASGEYTTKAVNTKLSKEVETNQKETGFEYKNYKDIDNFHGQFVGTWLYTNGTTSIKVVFEKRDMIYLSPPNPYYIDFLKLIIFKRLFFIRQ
jgi:hypothetical protein